MKPLCNAPFTSYSHKPEGYRPCCSRHAEPTIIDDHNWWNGEYMTDMRKKMFSYDTLPVECKACLDEQGAGGEKYSHSFDLKHYNPSTGVVSVSPSQVYLFTGNRCNLACDMCDSTFSDTHAKKFPERVIPVTGEFIDPIEIARHQNPSQWVVYGGEPFLYDNIEKLVLLLMQKGGFISFLTNGMYNIEKLKVFDYLARCKERVSLTFSIDGDKELNEKIRIGASTKRIIENAKKCQKMGFHVDIHFTHSTLNTHGFVDFCKMLLDEGMYELPFSINTAAVEYPSHYSPKTLDNNLKLKYIREIEYFMHDNIPSDMKKTCQDIINSLQYTKVGSII